MYLPMFVDYAEVGYKAINRNVIIPRLVTKVNKISLCKTEKF